MLTEEKLQKYIDKCDRCEATGEQVEFIGYIARQKGLIMQLETKAINDHTAKKIYAPKSRKDKVKYKR